MGSMNSIKQVTSGLASSLFLAAGLTRLAEKTDPMLKQNETTLTIFTDMNSTRFTELPCAFGPHTGQ